MDYVYVVTVSAQGADLGDFARPAAWEELEAALLAAKVCRDGLGGRFVALGSNLGDHVVQRWDSDEFSVWLERLVLEVKVIPEPSPVTDTTLLDQILRNTHAILEALDIRMVPSEVVAGMSLEAAAAALVKLAARPCIYVEGDPDRGDCPAVWPLDDERFCGPCFARAYAPRTAADIEKGQQQIDEAL